MPPLGFTYETRSRGGDERLDLAAARAPAPGAYEAVIAEPVIFRAGMLALGDVVRADFEWKSYDEWMEELERMIALCDPVVGIHPDGVSFEGFSLDGSTCGWLHFGNAVFGEPAVRRAGCTSIDFGPELWSYLNGLPASRPVTLRIGTHAGVELRDAGGAAHEKRIDLPDNWMQGFAELHAGLAQAEVVVPLGKTDLFNICRTIQLRKPPRGSRMKALVFELAPGERAHARLEPWDQRIPLQGAPVGVVEPVEWRVYGRRRLILLQRLLPHARWARVHLLGDSRPSYWEIDLGAARFILAMSPWTARKFTASIAESLRGPRAADAEAVLRARLRVIAPRFCRHSKS